MITAFATRDPRRRPMRSGFTITDAGWFARLAAAVGRWIRG